MSVDRENPAPARMRLEQRAFASIDIASLAFFRIAFGALMFGLIVDYFLSGWITYAYALPRFHFKFYGFEWVRPWPTVALHVHFAALGALALLIAIGLYYRVAMALFAVGYTYIFLLDSSLFQSHHYFICLISFWMILMPLNRDFSVDARLRPGLNTGRVPAWGLWMLRAHVSMVYIFGGVVKLNPDWLSGVSMQIQLIDASQTPVIGPLLGSYSMALGMTYIGLLLDLFIVPALLWRRTRPWAFAATVVFHCSNSMLFDIDIFPFLMLGGTTLFFPPDWPRRLFRLAPLKPEPAAASGPNSRPHRRLILGAIGLYFFLQIVIPFRHFLYPGYVAWTHEGGLFAWPLRLDNYGIYLNYEVTNLKTGKTFRIRPSEYITTRQTRTLHDPDNVLQLSHWIAEDLRRKGIAPVEIRAIHQVSLNGRPFRTLIDPKVDLLTIERSIKPADWIVRHRLDQLGRASASRRNAE